MPDPSPRSVFSRLDAYALFALAWLLLCLLPSCIHFARKGPVASVMCKNKLKQLGLAVLNRESATQRFPLAMFGDSAANGISIEGPAAYSETDGYSWVVGLLDYLEQSNLNDELVNASNGYVEPLNSIAFKRADGTWMQEASIDLLRCPNLTGNGLAKGKYGVLRKPQVCNYMAMVATCVEPDSRRFADRNPNTGGIIVTKGCVPRGLKTGDVADGTSRTVLIAESKAELYSFWFSGRSVSTVAMPPDLVDVNSLSTAKITGLNYGRSHRDKASQNPWFAAKYPPGKIDWGPSSSHTNAVAHVFADGHVRFISTDTSPDVYCRLVSRGGGGEEEAATEETGP